MSSNVPMTGGFGSEYRCCEIGSYNCQRCVLMPEEDGSIVLQSIDWVIIPELYSLWNRGIRTVGCCCGHGDISKAYIQVDPEGDNCFKMEMLGYKPLPPKEAPNGVFLGLDCFKPKTDFNCSGYRTLGQ